MKWHVEHRVAGCAGSSPARSIMTVNISISSFCEQQEAIRHIRHAVFVAEQGVPQEEEFDDEDRRCVHALAVDQGRPVGTGRLSRDGRIGRMAVLKQARRKGIGKAIAQALEQQAKQRGLDRLWVHSQVQAIGFYERLGFHVAGDQFTEAGIPHKLMQKPIQPATPDNGTTHPGSCPSPF